ncbi:hypothetical protein G3I43_15775 [Streptomyces anulatus]|uniref:WYL domain-containing protein n=1 Tax=Streptomyces anulatus TaxID=1892 RepID=A0A6G3SRH8_STRAQ|nr:WYL domain-containing protein [Streptomyces anulatus]NEB85626.1 hypothetical protein [Streptomyces anulatus]
MGTTTPPRTLAEALRARGDESLAGLLRARPDLLNPVPNDITQLATRAGTRASVVRALEHLDRFALQTAEALAVAPDPAPYDTLLSLLTGDGLDDGDQRDDAGAAITAALPRALATLREQALVWGEDDRLRLVRTARELLAPSPQHPSPTGLGPTVSEATAGMSPGRLQEILAATGLPATHDPVSAVAALAALFTDRTRMAELLDTAPVEALSVLDRLVWGPPYGEVTPNPTPPVKWLRDRGLLLPVSTRTVVLPREAALHLRAGRAHRVPEPVPPVVGTAAERDPQAVDRAASAYVRCDDEAVLNEILADRRSTGLRLRRLAPTVLAAQADPGSLLEALRDMGYAPAAESAEGDVLITRAGARRTPPRTPPAPVPDGPPVPDDTLLGAAVRAIRAGDTAATAIRRETSEDPSSTTPAGSLPRTTPAETLATVQAAAMTGSAVWIGYVNADGAASQRVIAPVRVEGGFVTAYDHTADEVRTYPLHRITGVAELAEDGKG